MKSLLFILVPIYLIFTCSVANAASFECTKASTPREQLICATPQLSTDDSQLGTAYTTTLALLPSAEAVMLQKDEQRWLKGLDDCRMEPRNAAAIKCLDVNYHSGSLSCRISR